MRQALAWCNAPGERNELAARQAEIEAILELMRALGCQQRQQEWSSFAAGWEGSWDDYRQAAAVSQGWRERYPRAVVQALACGGQAERQATNSKDDGIRQRLAQAAECYYDYAASLLPAASAPIRQEVVEALDAEVRSASLVEHATSALRPLRETCRGHVEQEMLELFASGHHHRRFVRGKRAGKAPIALLTGKELAQTWLEALLETV